MTEYLIILPTLFLLVLGVMQYALIYQAKASLNYATFMGARQGALKNANINSIKDGIASGMTPFFMRTNTTPSMTDMAKARLVAMIEIFNPNTAEIIIVSPSAAAFNKHSVDGSIPNDNLMFRPSGSKDKVMSIQDANLLKIKVTYCVKLIVPVVNRVIYALATGIDSVKNMTNENFWASSKEIIPNSCSMMNDKYAALRSEVGNWIESLPDDVTIEIGKHASANVQVDKSLKTTANSLANKGIDQLPALFPDDLPWLNWNIGGMRIPITAEAIVRMQSPVILED